MDWLCRMWVTKNKKKLSFFVKKTSDDHYQNKPNIYVTSKHKDYFSFSFGNSNCLDFNLWSNKTLKNVFWSFKLLQENPPPSFNVYLQTETEETILRKNDIFISKTIERDFHTLRFIQESHLAQCVRHISMFCISSKIFYFYCLFLYLPLCNWISFFAWDFLMSKHLLKHSEYETKNLFFLQFITYETCNDKQMESNRENVASIVIVSSYIRLDYLTLPR